MACTGDCSFGCGGDCDFSCTIWCNLTCYNTCAGCTSCSSCEGTCSGTCTSCDGCSGSCTSCSGCSGTCSGTCTSCDGCSGCSGCSACSGTCSGYCDNGCTAANQATLIANLGQNILNHGLFKYTDFTELRDAIHAELSRRNKTIPSDTYTHQPANGTFIYTEHPQKVFDDCKAMDSSKNYTINPARLIVTSDMSESIAYIKTLMAQNIRY